MMISGYLELAGLLESRIVGGDWRSGEKLPPLRELSREYGIKFNTVQRALGMLRAKGLLEARHGNGFFVVANRPVDTATGGPRIALLHHGQRNGDGITYYSSVALVGIQEYAQLHGISLQLHYLNDVPSRTVSPERLNGIIEQAEAVILLGAFDTWTDLEFPAGIPIVKIFPVQPGCGKSSVYLDPEESAALAVRYYQSRRVRHVRIYHCWGFEYKPLATLCFADLWDGTVEWMPPPRFRVEKPDFADFEDDYPAGIGYWFNYGTMADFYAKHFKMRSGKALAEERVVLAFDGKSLLNPQLYEPIDCVTPDWKQVGRLALREALRRIEEPGGGSAAIRVPVRLVALPRQL